ncbi:Rpn family recombination-promoting nuclease/putative transposase [uncultured Clostridium sp.]|uniref:Rpn family recombination-promoting nuclease/putative transposase n=1 Tax=uncultured Clostridium sp. TaxID=59620 RepID=UPI00263054CD|nr:Rpn family recombination-promoting nuclease/putative transposase [uncultured Clostridium sp.]
MNEENESVRLDEILKFSTTVSKGVLLKFLNSIFNEKFELNQVQITVSNNEFITEDLEKLRADVFFRIQDIKNFEKTNFHIEFQTLNDKTMVFRMLEYGFKKSLEERRLDTIIFPKQHVIFIEKNNKIPEKLELKIRFPKEQIVKYEVPIMKYWEYDDKAIIENKMYPLLPLQLFLLRKELARNFKNGNLKNKEVFIEKIKEKTEKLARKATELFQKGEILGEDYDKILVMIDYLISYLNKKYIYDEKIEEEIKVLNRTYLDTEAVEIGIQKGIEKGARKKQIEIAKNLIVLGLDKESIAKATGLKLEEVNKLKN